MQVGGGKGIERFEVKNNEIYLSGNAIKIRCMIIQAYKQMPDLFWRGPGEGGQTARWREQCEGSLDCTQKKDDYTTKDIYLYVFSILDGDWINWK